MNPESESHEMLQRKAKTIAIGVVTASPEAGSLHAKVDMAFSGWVWLIVESGNILCLRKLLHTNSSAVEVRNERVEVFACEIV